MRLTTLDAIQEKLDTALEALTAVHGYGSLGQHEDACLRRGIEELEKLDRYLQRQRRPLEQALYVPRKER